MSIGLTSINNQPKRRTGYSKRKRGGSNIRVLLLLLLIILVSCYAADRLRLYRYFTIKEINLEPTTYVSASYLDSLCSRLFLGASTLTSLSSQKEILEREPLILKVSFRRLFPDRLTVLVRERKPLALLNVGELLPIDDEGMVLPLDLSQHQLNLPILTPRSIALSLDAKPGVQSRINRDGRLLLEALLNIKQNSPELMPLISEFTFNEQGKVTVVTIEEGMRVVLGKWVNSDKLRYLKWMLEQVAETEEKPALVDLSFEGQIILKQNDEF
ncbi:cell division protein FtsQ/DivIB [Gemmatimonadota bacterium]